MSQDNAGKVQRPFEGDNANNAAELVNVKEEYKALEKKLREAEQKAQMAKNELEKIIRKNPHQLEELANVIAILEGPQTETIDSDQMELTLKPDTAQNSLERLRLPLPLELNCQIFECLKVPLQKKFICGVGRGIYRIFREKVLTKSKRLRNPEQNGWNNSSSDALISFKNCCASDNSGDDRSVFAKKGFPITGELARKEDNFAGTILYYFEVTQISVKTTSDDCEYMVGLSDGNNCNGFNLGFTPNSYCMRDDGIYYFLSGGGACKFELPNGDNGVPTRDGPGNVAGCGLLLDRENKVSIFFTMNGILLGIQMPISPSVDCLYPTLEMRYVSLEANFGNNPAKPFEYNI